MDWVCTMLAKMPGLSKPQRKFLVVLLTAILVVRGKVNFRNLARYSARSEKTYRRPCATSFDFVRFNRTVIDETFGQTSERIVVLDPSFLKKAGKKTEGLGYFYNGCANRAEKGLELSSVAIVELQQQTALTLSTRQSQPVAHKPGDLDRETLMDQYLDHLKAVHPHWHASEQFLVVDGQFARVKVFDAADELTMSVISKLRRDARMRYFYDGPKRPAGSGRQKVYDGYVDWTDRSRFEAVEPSRGSMLYTTDWTQGTHQMFLHTIRAHWRGWQLVLCEDRGSPHPAAESRALAAQLKIEIRFLPRATPELNAMDH